MACLDIHLIIISNFDIRKHVKKATQVWIKILRKMKLYQNDGKKRVLRTKGRARNSKQTTSSVKHGEAVLWYVHVWLPVELGHWCLYDDVTADRSSTLKSIELHSLLRLGQMLQN